MNNYTKSQAKFETLTKIRWKNNISVVREVFYTRAIAEKYCCL